jgi:diguanylate cyclase (GGDEF)-like protein
MDVLSALGVAGLGTATAFGVAARRGGSVLVRRRGGQLLRDLLDGALLASALLLIVWLELVRPLGERNGLTIAAYCLIGLSLADAIWQTALGRKAVRRPRLLAVVPWATVVIAASLYSGALLAHHSTDYMTLSIAVATFALLMSRQLLMAMDNAWLTQVLGAAEEALTFRADHDPLTDLPNRTLFRRHLERALTHRRRGRDGICTVLFVDLDDFKDVNDKIGHAGGDRVLVEVARRLRESLRAADTVARLGGDEFGILFEQVTAAGDLLEVAERMVESLRTPIEVDGVEVTLQATVAGELLRRADIALRLAKQRGKGMFGVFEASMHVAMDEPRRRRVGLEKALGMREFRVYYQPIVDVRNRSVAGAEALLRWAHPDAGLLGPDEFLTDLEDVGLIAEVGRWIVEEAVAQAASLRHELGVEFFVTVNISSLQLHDPGFVDCVRRSLVVSGLPADALVLELTESGSVADDSLALGRLHALRAAGVRLAIDDFGTGYSSMAYLHRFPVDVLKIDKSFIADLVEDSPDRRLAEELTRLGTSLGLQTIAEGVETEVQHRALENLGCPLAQGFFYGGALPKEQLSMALRAAGRPLRVVGRRTA